MTKIDSYIQEEISLLPKNELVKLVIKAASVNKQFHDYLLVNYINKKSGEKELFEQTKNDIEILFQKSYKGFSEELRLANMLAACNRRINEFSKIAKDKSLEMDLIMHVLKVPFSLPSQYFSTCFTRYNQQVYFLIKKAVTLINKKLHEDYHIQYAAPLNEYLEILHNFSDHLDYIYLLPKSV